MNTSLLGENGTIWVLQAPALCAVALPRLLLLTPLLSQSLVPEFCSSGGRCGDEDEAEACGPKPMLVAGCEHRPMAFGQLGGGQEWFATRWMWGSVPRGEDGA